jgi:hypothetical protein
LKENEDGRWHNRICKSFPSGGDESPAQTEEEDGKEEDEKRLPK